MRVLKVALAVLLTAAVLVWGAVLAREVLGSGSPASTPAGDLRPPVVGADGVEFGIALPEEDLGSVGQLEQVAGQLPQRFTYFRAWAQAPDFDTEFAEEIRAQGMQPMLVWEPMDPGSESSTDQPEFALQTITEGRHDDYIRRWAEQIRDWGHPLWIRFASEMNEDIHPWSAGVNGNHPEQYAQAYRHVVDVFREVGATNVAWNWSVAVKPEGGVPLAELYPGDDYVDEVGVDGYNGGTELDWGGWLSFDQVFGDTLHELREVGGDKPIHIAEVASSEQGGDKAEWIRDFFTQLRESPDIRAFTWFNYDKERSGEADWQIQTSPEAEQAFREGLAALRQE